MSGTTLATGNGTQQLPPRGRPGRKPGSGRTRRTRAQIAAAPGEPAATTGDLGTIVRGDPATLFAAQTIAQLASKETAVRKRAAQMIGAVCAEMLKAA
jgi:hypothetical protein